MIDTKSSFTPIKKVRFIMQKVCIPFRLVGDGSFVPVFVASLLETLTEVRVSGILRRIRPFCPASTGKGAINGLGRVKAPERS